MSDPRIISVELDEATILRRNADIEQERRVAIFDLIEDNVFKPLRDMGDGYAGPYRLKLSVTEGRLIWDISARGWQSARNADSGPRSVPASGARIFRDLRQLLSGDPQGDRVRDRNHRHGAARRP